MGPGSKEGKTGVVKSRPARDACLASLLVSLDAKLRFPEQHEGSFCLKPTGEGGEKEAVMVDILWWVRVDLG